MTCNVWFTPSNSSHVGKNLPLLAGLAERDCRVRILGLDELQKPIYAARSQIERSGYEFEMLRVEGFQPDRHWLFQGLRRRDLVAALRRFFATHPVDVMLFGADSGLVSRTTGDVARSLGIPTVLVVDGLVAPRNPRHKPGLIARCRNHASRRFREAVGAGGVGRTSGADLMLVVNEMSRRELLRWGISPGRVRVVGSPEYDLLAAELRKDSAGAVETEVRKRLGIAPERPVVFFAHQDIGVPVDVMRESIEQMVRAAAPQNGVVLVKFHPRGGDKPDVWRDWARSRGFSNDEVLFLLNECTSVEAARICSVCATFFSTVSIEAMICGKPVVLMLYHDYPYAIASADTQGAALDAHRPADLGGHVARLLSEPAFREACLRKVRDSLAKEMFGLDGLSVERSIHAITDLSRRSIGTPEVGAPAARS